MRVLKFLFSSAIIVGILGAVGFLIWREYMLMTGISQLRASMRQVTTIATNSGTYVNSCRERGVLDLDTGAIQAIQIRFTSSTTYQVEVVCNQFALDPIIAERASLPRFVEKVPGESGIIWGEARSGVALSMFGRTRSIYVEDSQVHTGELMDVQGSFGPVTSCSGHGFTCCQAETSIGEGSQLTNVTDCRASCFSSCVPRPVVLSFTTQPFYDLKTRVLYAPKGQEVTVAYVLDPAGSENLDVTIDFGDGSQNALTQFTGSTTHIYNCQDSSCSYQLKIEAVNEHGISSAQTPVTSVTVFVQ